jgi:hypothetical protein
MPYHYHPRLRDREDIFEQDGLYFTQDSVGLTRLEDAESAGTRPARESDGAIVRLRGTEYTPPIVRS